MKTFLKMLLGQFGVLIWQALRRLDDKKTFDRALELAMVYVARLDGVPDVSGASKFEMATANIISDLQSVGMSLAKDLIGLAVQTALVALRSQAGASAQ